jgi:hypothetical protein
MEELNYPCYVKDGIYMFKVISKKEYVSVHFAEISGFFGIEFHLSELIIYKKSQIITEKEFNFNLIELIYIINKEFNFN